VAHSVVLVTPNVTVLVTPNVTVLVTPNVTVLVTRRGVRSGGSIRIIVGVERDDSGVFWLRVPHGNQIRSPNAPRTRRYALPNW